MNIGKVIKEVIEKKGVNITQLANKLGMKRNNLYNIYKRESIDTYLLMQLSINLNYNFFTHLSDDFIRKNNGTDTCKEITLKVTLKENDYFDIISHLVK